MGKVMYDGGRADKNLALVVRIIVGGSMLVAFLLMFFIHPHVSGNVIDTKSLWEAVHPFNWFFDLVALIGFIVFGLFIMGLAGKTIYGIVGTSGEKSGNMINAIAIIAALSMLLFFA